MSLPRKVFVVFLLHSKGGCHLSILLAPRKYRCFLVSLLNLYFYYLFIWFFSSLSILLWPRQFLVRSPFSFTSAALHPLRGYGGLMGTYTVYPTSRETKLCCAKNHNHKSRACATKVHIINVDVLFSFRWCHDANQQLPTWINYRIPSICWRFPMAHRMRENFCSREFTKKNKIKRNVKNYSQAHNTRWRHSTCGVPYSACSGNFLSEIAIFVHFRNALVRLMND